MEEITAYKCEYCGNIFLTATRHKCKYDPKFKNCYSCEHNIEFRNEIDIINSPSGNGVEREEMNVYVNCDKGHCIGAKEISDLKQDLNCKDHKDCGGKWYENEHADYREKAFDERDYPEF